MDLMACRCVPLFGTRRCLGTVFGCLSRLSFDIDSFRALDAIRSSKRWKVPLPCESGHRRGCDISGRLDGGTVHGVSTVGVDCTIAFLRDVYRINVLCSTSRAEKIYTPQTILKRSN